MRMGHGPRRAVVILWLWTALLSAVVLAPTFTERGNSLVPVAVVALGLLLYIYFHPGVRTAREERGRRPGRRPGPSQADGRCGRGGRHRGAPAGAGQRMRISCPRAVSGLTIPRDDL